MDFDEDPDYLDLDNILAQTQSVECKFLINIPGLEFLSPSCSQEAVQGAKVKLPFWMAKTLYTYSMIDIEVPKAYNENFREILTAEPNVVNLHKWGPHYYEFGKMLLGLKREKGNNLDAYTEEGQRNKYRREEGETLEDKPLIAASLIDTFHQRRHKLLDYSINRHLREDEIHSYESILDNLERRLFQLGRQQVNEMNLWTSRKIELIATNIIAARLTKRRKLESSSKNLATNK